MKSRTIWIFDKEETAMTWTWEKNAKLGNSLTIKTQTYVYWISDEDKKRHAFPRKIEDDMPGRYMFLGHPVKITWGKKEASTGYLGGRSRTPREK